MDLISHLVFVRAADIEDSNTALHRPLIIFLLSTYFPLDHISQPHELRHKGRLWHCPHFRWCARADDPSVVQDQNTISNGEGFLLIVSYINGGNICLMQN